MPLRATLERCRRTACALLLIALAWGAGAVSCTTAGEPPQLRVMSYNIAAGFGDLAGIADVIRTADPDVVGLQEVDVHWGERSGFADQAAWLGDELGMHVRFGPIYVLPAADTAAGAALGVDTAGASPRQFGLAILSRDSIVQFTNHAIPRLSTQAAETEPRPLPGFLEAVIDWRGTRVHVFNTHLDYRADPRVREQQTAAMLDVIGERTGPLILMGDLNAPPDAPELEALLTRLHDAWSAGQGEGFTYPADSPTRRIDYVLYSDALRAERARVVETAASDHRPVMAILTGHPGELK